VKQLQQDGKVEELLIGQHAICDMVLDGRAAGRKLRLGRPYEKVANEFA
jgi:hypothetical protein